MAPTGSIVLRMLTATLILALASAQAAETPAVPAPEAAPAPAPAAAPAPAVQAAPAEAAPAPAPAPAVQAAPAAIPVAEARQPAAASTGRRLHWAFGVGMMGGLAGLGGGMEVGVDFGWWDAIGFRTTLGVTLQQEWGTVWLAPEAVWRLADPEAALVPQLGAGLLVGAVSVPDPDLAMSQGAIRSRSDAAGSAPPEGPGVGGGKAISGIAFSVGPEVSGALALKTGRKSSLELAARYGLVFAGDTYHQVTFTLALSGLLQ